MVLHPVGSGQLQEPFMPDIPLSELEKAFGRTRVHLTMRSDKTAASSTSRADQAIADLAKFLPEAEAFFTQCSDILHSGSEADASRPSERLVDHYEIGRELGQGGMSTVYLAVDKHLDRRVALKVIPFEEGIDRQDFLREAQNIGALDHANVCEVYAAGFTSSGSGYLVMPFYQGMSVRRLIEEGDVSQELAASIIEQTARGLAAAHSAGILHRDIKPDNLILDENGVVKIIDFGIAQKELASKERRDQALRGTLPYMSPESFSSGKITVASDLWSLGITAYELAMGEQPFAGRDIASFAEAIQREDLPDHSELAGSLTGVIDGCLKKNPAARIASATEIADLLHVEPEQPWLAKRVNQLIALISIVIVVFGSSWMLTRETRQADPELGFEVQPTGWDITHSADGGALLIEPFEVSGNDLEATTGQVIALQLMDRMQGLLGLTPTLEPGNVKPYMTIRGRVAHANGTGVVLVEVFDHEGSPLHNASIDISNGTISNERIDELARRIISRFVVDAGNVDDNYHAIKNVPFSALREFLLAQHKMVLMLDEGEYLQHYLNAIESDSLFGLAHYALANTIPHFARPNASDFISKAYELQDQFRGMAAKKLEADYLRHTDQIPRADSALQALIGQYPNDRNVWSRWGDFQYHYNYQFERPYTDALDSFLNAYLRQPEHLYGLSEMSYLLIQSRHYDRWNELGDRLMAERERSTGVARVFLADLIAGPDRKRENALNQLRQEGYLALELASKQFPLISNDYRLALEIVEDELDWAEADLTAADDLRVLDKKRRIAYLKMIMGDYAPLIAYDQATKRNWIILSFAEAPFQEYPEHFLEEVERQWTISTSNYYFASPYKERNRELIKNWQLALVALHRGVSYQHRQERLSVQASQSPDSAFAYSLVDMFRGEIAFRSGRFEEAIAAFKQAEWFDIHSPWDRRMRSFEAARTRRSQALIEVGRYQEAIDLANTVGDGMIYSGPDPQMTMLHRPALNLIRARAHAKLRLPLKAVEYLDRAQMMIRNQSSWQAEQIRLVEAMLDQ